MTTVKTGVQKLVSTELLWLAAGLAAAFAMIVVNYGLDGVVPGAHDMFHDFRHTIGMACH